MGIFCCGRLKVFLVYRGPTGSVPWIAVGFVFLELLKPALLLLSFITPWVFKRKGKEVFLGKSKSLPPVLFLLPVPCVVKICQLFVVINGFFLLGTSGSSPSTRFR
jgi:hypothetical protein